MSDVLDDPDENALVKLTALLVLGVGLTSLFLGYSWFWMVFAVGFAVLVPVVKVVTSELNIGAPDESPARSSREQSLDQLGTDTAESKQDALDTLRTRYATGELSEAEFERKVERLLETETVAQARENITHSTGDDRTATSRNSDRVTER